MSSLKIVTVPRDPCPYQELLYGPMRELGASVRYGCTATPSHTLNLLLAPLELAWCRLRGYNVYHLHWTWGFAPTASGKSNVLRRAGRLWFGFVLRCARALGYRVVWTAHNVVPHEPVFDDDIKARQTLVGSCDLVIAHGSNALEGLAAIGARPCRSEVIPLGPIVSEQLTALPLPRPAGKRTVMFFGRIATYKGVEDLLDAVAVFGRSLNVVIAGSCPDRELRERLTATAGRLTAKVELRLDHVPEAELETLFAAADALVFPFREVTTSASVMLGMSSGRPIVVPDLPAFDELPAEALIRYPPGREGLKEALAKVATMPTETFVAKGSAARAGGASVGWTEIADRTAAAIRGIRPARSPLAAFRANHLLVGSTTLQVNAALLSALGFVFWVIAARLYASSSIGLYAGLNAGATILGTVAALGWPLTVIRFLPTERHQRRLILIMILSVLLLGTAIVGVVELVAGPFLFPALNIPTGVTDGVLTLIMVMVSSIGSVVSAALVSQRATRTVLITTVIGAIVRIASLLPLVFLGTTGLIIAATGGGVLAAVLASVALWRRLPASSGPWGSLERTVGYIRYSATGYVAMVFGILPSTVVPLIVLGSLGARRTGWFSIAFLVVGLLSIVPTTTSQVLFAESSRGPEYLRRNLMTAIKAIYGLLLPAALLLFVASPLVLSLLGPEYERHATNALRIMAAGSLFLGATYLIDSVFTAVDRMRSYFMINAINACLVVALVAVVAGRGLTAVAVAWAAAQGLSVIAGVGILAGPRLLGTLQLRARPRVREKTL
jgi:O-antigen/teichoic acid export membrane protein/glycosyltransferase involved in cell wall biosynthesis